MPEQGAVLVVGGRGNAPPAASVCGRLPEGAGRGNAAGAARSRRLANACRAGRSAGMRAPVHVPRDAMAGRGARRLRRRHRRGRRGRPRPVPDLRGRGGRTAAATGRRAAPMVAAPGRHGAARLEVLRALHTLKGSARLAGAMRLGERAHRMESAIETLGTEGADRADDRAAAARASTRCRPPSTRCAPPTTRSQTELVATCRRRDAVRRRKPVELPAAAAARIAPRPRRSQPLRDDARRRAPRRGHAVARRRSRRCAPSRARRCACAPSCWTAWSTRPAR